MAKIAEAIEIKASIERVYEVITDFEHYPDFQPDIDAATVISKTKTKARVAFVSSIVQQIEYTLEFKMEYPKKVSWKLIESNSVMKSNTGSWTLVRLGKNLTEAVATADIGFPFWVPSAITDSVMATHAPKMMRAMKKRAEKNYSNS